MHYLAWLLGSQFKLTALVPLHVISVSSSPVRGLTIGPKQTDRQSEVLRASEEADCEKKGCWAGSGRAIRLWCPPDKVNANPLGHREQRLPVSRVLNRARWPDYIYHSLGEQELKPSTQKLT